MPLDNATIRSCLTKAREYLLSHQCEDGGFKREDDNISDAWTTAEAVLALQVLGTDRTSDHLRQAVRFLRLAQRPDGSWASSIYDGRHDAQSGDVAATSYAVRALAGVPSRKNMELCITGCNWLISRQRDDGGWGIAAKSERRSHIGLSAYAVCALSRGPSEQGVAESIQEGLYFLYQNRGTDGGWCLAPGQQSDMTLTAYVLRALIDACVLRGYRPEVDHFVNWIKSAEGRQNQDGSWSDWHGNSSSVEATSYAVEIASSIAPLSLSAFKREKWLAKAAKFLINSQNTDGGWGRIGDSKSSAWITHYAVIALSRVSGNGAQVALNLPDELLGSIWQPAEGEPKSGTYDFALSFAGSDRLLARALAWRIRQRGAEVFFDQFEADELWGTNLVERLTEIYRDRAKFCIMLISSEYIKRAWPRLERQSAQARALMSSEEYILPVLLEDNVKVPGLLETVGYLKMSEHSIDEIARLAMAKVSKS